MYTTSSLLEILYTTPSLFDAISCHTKRSNSDEMFVKISLFWIQIETMIVFRLECTLKRIRELFFFPFCSNTKISVFSYISNVKIIWNTSILSCIFVKSHRYFDTCAAFNIFGLETEFLNMSIFPWKYQKCANLISNFPEIIQLKYGNIFK